MQHGDRDEEPSMDEILSSIRKIIAEDEVVPVAVGEPSAHPPVRLTRPGADDDTLTLSDADEGPLSDDDVDILDLSADDEVDEPEPHAAAPALDELVEELAEDLVADELVTDFDDDAASDAETGDEPAVADTASEPVAVPADSAAKPRDADHASLLERGSVEQAGGALQRLTAAMVPHAALSGGDRSVEVFLADLLRPELKAWLDGNLPALVERIVEREIKKLVRDAQPA